MQKFRNAIGDPASNFLVEDLLSTSGLELILRLWGICNRGKPR